MEELKSKVSNIYSSRRIESLDVLKAYYSARVQYDRLMILNELKTDAHNRSQLLFRKTNTQIVHSKSYNSKINISQTALMPLFR